MPAKRKAKKDTAEEEPEDKQAKAEPEEAAADDKKKGKKGKEKTEKPKAKKEASVSEVPEGVDVSFPTEINQDAKTEDGRKFNIKIASWNINGIRAWLDKKSTSYLTECDPDILCVQETKCAEDKIPKGAEVSGYTSYWYSAETEGYAGTGIYTKTKPINVTKGLGIKKHDNEGRVITAEYEKFFLVTSYVPNSGRGLPRLPYRTKEWDVDFTDYLNKLDKKKPVIMCGDLNVAHLDIDLKNPKGNKKTAGFTPEEREGFSNMLEAGYIDSFRELYPEARECYSFWTYMGNARAKNVGWRLDYFVLSKRLKKDLCDSIIQQKYMGSDHCPILLQMAF